MPTIVSPENRKLAFRRRIRLNKPEEAALAAFLKLVEERAMSGKITIAKDLKASQTVAALGITYLGSGCFKSAFALPGGRWVVKLPNRVEMMRIDRSRFDREVARNITPEATVYTNATPEDREILAAVRVEACGWATLQERAMTTVGKYNGDDHREVTRRASTVKAQGLRMGLEDLHDENLAVRADKSVCVIDYAKPQF